MTKAKKTYRLAIDFKTKESMKEFVDALAVHDELGDVAVYPMDALHKIKITEDYIVRAYGAGNGLNPL